jgi:YVTN family beta-propeller protein
VIDAATNTVVATPKVGYAPFGVAIRPDGQRVYITNNGGDSVSQLNGITNAPENGTITTGHAPYGAAVSLDGRWLFTANAESDSVTVIRAGTGDSYDLPVQPIPYGVAASPDGRFVYVVSRGSPFGGARGSLSVIEIVASSNGPKLFISPPTVAGNPIPVGNYPAFVAITPDGRTAYVTNQGGQEGSGDISVVDTPSRAVVRTIQAGRRPTGIAITPNGTRAYVANLGSNTVSVINTVTQTLVGTIPVGSGPFGVAITPDGNRVYVTNLTSGTVSVIDVATSAIVATIPVGPGPFDIAIAPAFNIELRYGPNVTSNQQDAVENAAFRWERVITGGLLGEYALPNLDPSCPWQGTLEFINDLVIYVDAAPIDGPGNVIAQAGPCQLRPDGSLPNVGQIGLDIADLPTLTSVSLYETVLHEMAHVLGFATVWDVNGLFLPRALSHPGFFIGPNTVAEWQNALGCSVIYIASVCDGVPLETEGGVGTEDAHWSEAIFDNELMTGWLDRGSNPLSRFTIASLRDIGYRVDYAAASPYTLPFTTQSGSVQRVSVQTEEDPRGIQLREIITPPRYEVDEDGARPIPAGGIPAMQRKQEVLDSLQAAPPTENKKTDKLIALAAKAVASSLEPKLWETDRTLSKQTGQTVFVHEQTAVKELMKVLSADGPRGVDAENLIKRLVRADAAIAQVAINQAIEERNAASRELSKAYGKMREAQQHAERGEFDVAVKNYLEAWVSASKGRPE